MPFEAFVAVGLGFLLGLLVGSLVRVPARALLALVGVALGVYGFLAPGEVEGWFRDWGLYLQREVPRWVDWGVRWVEWGLREPQRAVEYLGGVLLSVGPQYAFWAGVVGRVLA